MIKPSFYKNRRGFTVIELSVTMVTMAMIVATLGVMMCNALRGWSSGVSHVGADARVSTAAHKLWQEVRLGKSAYTVKGTSLGDQLYVVVPPLVTDVNHETFYDLSAAGTTHRYYVSNDVLYRQIGTGTAEVFARGISRLEVFGVSGPMVMVRLLRSVDRDGAVTTNEDYVQQKILMRNSLN